jgi:hypothetical protein
MPMRMATGPRPHRGGAKPPWPSTSATPTRTAAGSAPKASRSSTCSPPPAPARPSCSSARCATAPRRRHRRRPPDRKRRRPPARLRRAGHPDHHRRHLPSRRAHGRPRPRPARHGRLALLFIENVGNLVCPASYDLGEDEARRAAVRDRRRRQAAEVPRDLPPCRSRARHQDRSGRRPSASTAKRPWPNIRQTAPKAQILEVSAKTGAGARSNAVDKTATELMKML